MKSRTWKYLRLRPTGNIQGPYKFLNLTTVKKLKKKYWTPMPMPYNIIKRVEYLASKYRRSGSSGGWRFRSRNNERLADVTERDDE